MADRGTLPSNVTTSAGVGTRLKVWVQGVPLATRLVIGLCCGVYLYELIFGNLHKWVCLSPFFFSPAGFLPSRFYTLFTFNWFHQGILHLLMNMMAFYFMSCTLEHRTGTLRYSWLLFIMGVLGGLIHVGVSYFLSLIGLVSLKTCGVGYSGVIFGVLVIECHLSETLSRSVFGFFTVPSKLYPWILLALMQIIIPNASFLGHMAGIFTGYLYLFGLLELILIGTRVVPALEGLPPLKWITKYDFYIANQPPSPARLSWSGLKDRVQSLMQKIRPPTANNATTSGRV
ncbi:rhomboid-like protein [Pelomyxa schiedti]|nr:rhomboid-like protein [Pelomyxa schiedti]